MRIRLRILGLDVIDLDLSTGATFEEEHEGDDTGYLMGFSAPTVVPSLIEMPDRQS